MSAGTWRTAVDARTGQTYYYNRATRETRWTPPEGDNHRRDDRDLDLDHGRDAGAAREGAAREPEDAQLERARLAQRAQEAGWDIREAVDPRSGRVYFYDRKTRQVFWSDPRQEELNEVVLSARDEGRPSTASRAASSRAGSRADDERLYADQLSDGEDQGYEDDLDFEDEQPDGYPIDGHAGRRGPGSSEQSNGSGQEEEEEEEEEEVEESADLIEERLARLMHAARLEESGDTSFDDIDALRERAPKERGGRATMHTDRAASLSPSQSSHAGADAPIEQVRSSLALLKRRMQKSKTKQPSRARNAWQSAESPPARRAQLTSQENEVFESPSQASSARRTLASDACTRKTGCTCSDCARGMSGPVASELIPCESCGRSFGANALRVHEPVCGKVFTASATKSSSGRGSSSAQRNQAKSSPDAGARKQTSWRSKSQQLRMALQSKPPTGSLTSTLSTTASSAAAPLQDDEGLVACPHCERTFNPKSAERHIPVCTSIRAKPKKLLRGTGRGAYASSKAAHLRGNSQSPASERGMESFGGDRSSTFGSGTGNGPTMPSSARRKSMPTGRRSVAESGVELRECPHCYRQFGKKAYDRHFEYCSSLRERNEKLGIPHVTSKARPPRNTAASRQRFLQNRANEDNHHYVDYGEEAMGDADYMGAYYGDFVGDAYGSDDLIHAAEFEGNENLNPYYYASPYEFVEERDSLRAQLQNT